MKRAFRKMAKKCHPDRAGDKGTAFFRDITEAYDALPDPKTENGIPLDQALKERRSVRGFTNTPLTLSQVSQLLWAAQGMTDRKGHRTAPSAIASYTLEVYVAAGNVEDLPPGTYHYSPKEHSIGLISPGDPRVQLVDAAIGQEWIKSAPAIFIITGSASRLPQRAGDKAQRYMAIEAGLAAQGFLLEAVSLGLGGTFVGGFRDSDLSSFLKLPAGESPLAVLPAGRKK